MSPPNESAPLGGPCGAKLTGSQKVATRPSTKQGGGLVISADTIAGVRDGFPQYAETLGAVSRTGPNRWRMSCPLPEHCDNRPSFAIFASHRGGYRAKCSCGWTGDAVSLARALHPGMTFPQAVEHVAELLGIEFERVPESAEEARKRKQARTIERKPELPPLPDLPADFEQRHRAARARLYGSRRLLEAAALTLGVSPEVIQSMTYTTDALGWAGGRLLYLYEHGAKVRNPKGTEPRFRWLEGRAVFPWRWHFAAREEVREVIVTESESDAIAHVAAGVEELHPKKGKPACAVVAIPGANNFQAAWAPLFRGKRVTLDFDWDGKSDQGRDKTARLLTKHAARVAIA